MVLGHSENNDSEGNSNFLKNKAPTQNTFCFLYRLSPYMVAKDKLHYLFHIFIDF